jgi:hypothetical protein
MVRAAGLSRGQLVSEWTDSENERRRAFNKLNELAVAFREAYWMAIGGHASYRSKRDQRSRDRFIQEYRDRPKVQQGCCGKTGYRLPVWDDEEPSNELVCAQHYREITGLDPGLRAEKLRLIWEVRRGYRERPSPVYLTGRNTGQIEADGVPNGGWEKRPPSAR